MKIINIKGGLGNQMFQYAYGRALELSGKKIVFDISFFNGNKATIDTARDFKLDKFNIETKTIFSSKKRPLVNFIKKILIKLGILENDYKQSEKYFLKNKDIIIKEFSLKNQLSNESLRWQEKIKSKMNSVSLHIRRGDYLRPDYKNYFSSCGLEYYQAAVQEIIKRKGDNIALFVFSDDIAWAKENLQFPYPINFVSNKQIPDYEEMYLMSQCQNNIIANSTFSWWGAWLNQNNDKIVIGPKYWFAKKTSNDIDILPKTWIQI